MNVIEKGASAARARRRGDVIVISVMGGLYTLKKHKQVRDFVVGQLIAEPARSIVFDMRSAVLLIGAAGYGEAVEIASDVPRGERLPVAVVTTPAELEAITLLCAAMNAAGFRWVPFVDPHDALDWASRRLPRHSLFAPL